MGDLSPRRVIAVVRRKRLSTKLMILRVFILTTCIAVTAAAFAQDSGTDTDPFGVPKGTYSKTEWAPTHPDGDTPHDRMLSLAHTDGLPRFDRVELYAVSMPKPFSDEEPKREPSDKTFPVRPYGVFADIHAQKTIKGDACDELRKAWQSLTFDRLGGAFCHSPVYGFDSIVTTFFVRNNDLLGMPELYVPRYDDEKQRYTHGWYGLPKTTTRKRCSTYSDRCCHIQNCRRGEQSVGNERRSRRI